MGNIFIADDNRIAAALNKEGDLDVTVNVISRNEIKILYSPKVRVFKK